MTEDLTSPGFRRKLVPQHFLNYAHDTIMAKTVKESDWRAFRDSLVEWRERYLEAVTEQLADLLRDGERTPTERFWETKERIDKEGKILRNCLDGFSRSKMEMHLDMMYQYGLIGDKDLERFSEELRDKMLRRHSP